MLFAPELHFGNDVLVPDLAGWRRERLPSVPNDPYLTLAPDWALESGSLEHVEEHHGNVHVRVRSFDVLDLELQALWT